MVGPAAARGPCLTSNTPTQTPVVQRKMVVSTISSLLAHKLYYLFAVLVLLCMITSRIQGDSKISTSAPRLRAKEKQKCIHRIGGVTSEGIGSYFQHFKTSAILAHYTHSNLNIVSGTPKSTHGYEYGSIISGLGCDYGLPVDMIERTCYVNSSHLDDMLPSICHQLMTSIQILQMLSLSHCSDIVHEVDREMHEDFNDCMTPFYQRHLLPFQPTYSWSSNLRIGIHLRWGDLQIQNITQLSRNFTLDRRSIPIEMAIQALKNINAVGCGDHEVKIYMKDAIIVHDLPYSIVDTGNDFNDLIDYMSNDVLIQGTSSYSVLAAFAISNKIIRSNVPSHAKYNQRFLQANKIFGVKETVRISCPFQSYGRNLAKA